MDNQLLRMYRHTSHTWLQTKSLSLGTRAGSSRARGRGFEKNCFGAQIRQPPSWPKVQERSTQECALKEEATQERLKEKSEPNKKAVGQIDIGLPIGDQVEYQHKCRSAEWE